MLILIWFKFKKIRWDSRYQRQKNERLIKSICVLLQFTSDLLHAIPDYINTHVLFWNIMKKLLKFTIKAEIEMSYNSMNIISYLFSVVLNEFNEWIILSKKKQYKERRGHRCRDRNSNSYLCFKWV